MTPNYPFKNTFLTQLVSVNIRSREFPNSLTKMLASQERMKPTMSLQGDDALVLVDILDQASESNMELDLRRKSVLILRKVCGSHTILPHSCIISGNITREDDIAFASGGFADVWKGHLNGNRVCIKAFRTHTNGAMSKIKKRLFQEIAIWRRLSHPNVLPVLGVSQKPFPFCVITEWMINGNITDFTSKHPKANRLHLLAEAANGLQYLHSMGIIHGNLKPANILIDHDFHPRLVDYGLPLCSDLRYLPPELLKPSASGLKNGIPTEKSDIFAFGTVTHQVLTGQQPFFGVGRVVTGDVLNLLFRCWSPFEANRPEPTVIVNTLNDAGDVFELRSEGLSEPDLNRFLNDCKGGPEGDQDRKKATAQGLVDKLDLAVDNGGLHRRKRKKCQKYLRKLCGIFGILPKSFTLKPPFNEREREPFASGGFSYVYKAILGRRLVAIKTLKVTVTTDLEKVRRILIKEAVGWKWLRHDNIVPFVGVLLESPHFSIISDRMENGNIMEFIRAHPNHDRLRLLAGAAAGLLYLHERDIIHGDLKGANVLIDSNYRARLADFGLITVIDESTAGSTANQNGMRGTIRWMAPEMMYPEMFGFDSKCGKRLPSRSTDIYALGMTVLEVVTGCPPFSDILVGAAVICKVIGGGRPDRPPSTFSDQLWELLETTWCADHGYQPSRRPSAAIILERLNEDVRNWEKSIIPPASVQGAESTGGVSDRAEGAGSRDTQTFTVVHRRRFPFRPSQTDPSQAVQYDPRGTGVRMANRLRQFFDSGFFNRLRGFLMNSSPSG